MAGEIVNKPTDVLTGKTGTMTAEPTVQPTSDLAEAEKSKQPTVITDDPSALYCDALNEQNINQIADGKAIVRVALVGFEEYGKSTFASSLYYNFFTKERFCDHVLYDSETYSGFERRILIRRMDIAPDIKSKRTIKGENPLLVMSLMSEATGKYKLVLSDRSGEDYSQFAGTIEEIADNQLLKVADHVIFFVDSVKMTENFGKLRYLYKNFLNELVNKDLLGKNAQVKVVFNKYDQGKGHQEYHDKKKQVEAMFSEVLGTDRKYDVFEIDSTGASDKFASVEELTKSFLLGADVTMSKKKKLLDWANNELND